MTGKIKINCIIMVTSFTILYGKLTGSYLRSSLYLSQSDHSNSPVIGISARVRNDTQFQFFECGSTTTQARPVSRIKGDYALVANSSIARNSATADANILEVIKSNHTPGTWSIFDDDRFCNGKFELEPDPAPKNPNLNVKISYPRYVNFFDTLCCCMKRGQTLPVMLTKSDWYYYRNHIWVADGRVLRSFIHFSGLFGKKGEDRLLDLWGNFIDKSSTDMNFGSELGTNFDDDKWYPMYLNLLTCELKPTHFDIQPERTDPSVTGFNYDDYWRVHPIYCIDHHEPLDKFNALYQTLCYTNHFNKTNPYINKTQTLIDKILGGAKICNTNNCTIQVNCKTYTVCERLDLTGNPDNHTGKLVTYNCSQGYFADMVPVRNAEPGKNVLAACRLWEHLSDDRKNVILADKDCTFCEVISIGECSPNFKFRNTTGSLSEQISCPSNLVIDPAKRSCIDPCQTTGTLLANCKAIGKCSD